MTIERHELSDVIEQPRYLELRTSVEKMLYLFAAAHEAKADEFQKLLQINQGRRKVFATSRAEIEKSGVSPSPRNIGGTQYWVLTKSSTDQKQRLVSEALTLLEYSRAAVVAAAASLVVELTQ